jgi:peptide/nickel transport system substrate-binding protein
LKTREKEGNFTVYNVGPSSGSDFLFFNQNTSVNPNTGKTFISPEKLSWFTDVNFRRGVAHAIDRERIIEIQMNGLGYELFSPISPNMKTFYNPDVKKYPYDLEKAKAVLKEAGFFDRNGDGWIDDKEGNTVQFTLATNSGAVERIQIAGIVRADLERLGMKVNFKILEFNTLVNQLTANFEWEAVLLGLTGGGYDPHFSVNIWMSSAGLHMWYPNQKSPATDWEARVDEIFRDGVKELDEAKRKELYDEFQMIISEQVPVLYTVLNARLFAVRNKFGNLKPTNYGGALHNLEEIYIKKSDK